MKRNILPTYIDSPAETIDVSVSNKPISGKSSFVLVVGPSSGTQYLSLPSRTSDDRPVVPGTMVTIIRKDAGEGTVIVGLGDSIPTGSDNLYGMSLLDASGDSCTFMFLGENASTDYDAWILVSSDIAATAATWSGGSVTINTTFSANALLYGSLTKIGNSPVDDLQIASNFRFSDSNNNPTIAFNTVGSGTATLNDSAHPNAAIISFTPGWANGDTAVITLPTGVTFEAERFILKNQAAGISGDIEVTADDQITFTASGECDGDLGYLVIVMGS
jgi:hypothetical protein